MPKVRFLYGFAHNTHRILPHKGVHRALGNPALKIQNMGIDHGSSDIVVSQ